MIREGLAGLLEERGPVVNEIYVAGPRYHSLS
jgi:hypothetical protein